MFTGGVRVLCWHECPMKIKKESEKKILKKKEN